MSRRRADLSTPAPVPPHPHKRCDDPEVIQLPEGALAEGPLEALTEWESRELRRQADAVGIFPNRAPNLLDASSAPALESICLRGCFATWKPNHAGWAAWVFDGAANDHQTVGSQIGKLKARFGLDHVVLVGDREMVSETTIRKELEPIGLDWITSLKSVSVRKLAEARVITLSLFDTHQVAEIQHPDFPGERLIASFNLFTKERNIRRIEDLLLFLQQAQADQGDSH